MSDLQPRLSTRSKAILEIDGLRFRDLDGNGELTPYEDWRLPAAERATDLLSRLALEHKVGLMIIGSQYLEGSAWVSPEGGFPDLSKGVAELFAAPPPAGDGNLLREQDGYASHQPITGAPLDAPKLYASSARGAIQARHQRRLIVRDNPAARDLATWANSLQELAEDTEFGIPVVLTSNPRNHVSVAARLGLGEAGGVFTEWPGELGLAAIGDADLVREFAGIAAREWRSAGLRKVYGYMADLPSEPRWSRFDGTFGEDPQLVADLIVAVIKGFQGERLGPDSVAITVKHFPGGGVRTDGHDPHFTWGQDNDYPTAGSLERYHLPPFQAAIAAGVASVMPYYSRPVNSSADQLPAELRAADGQFEEVAFAYNAAFLTGLLRERLGFTGYVNTDSGVLDAMAYGVEPLSREQRWAKLVRAGSDVVGDEVDPAGVLAAVASGALQEAELDRSILLLLEEMFTLGLFENPYVDPDEAAAVAADPAHRQLADQAQRRSVTLLRNDAGLLPLRADGHRKVYAEVFARGPAEPRTAQLREAIAARIGADLVDDVRSADIAIAWVQPEISLFGGDDRPGVEISVELAARGIDVERLHAVQNAAPTALVVDFSNPWVIADVEPGAAAVVATFGVRAEHLVAVLFGEDEPGGRLPLAVPRSARAVAESPRDVPGSGCGPEYAYLDRAGSRYDFGFGLRYPAGATPLDG